MTTDHDPRELRAIAQRVADGYAATTCCTELGDYILATVRDDDGEEQPDTTVTVPAGGYVVVTGGGTYRVEHPQTMLLIPYPRPTRGQFRALCRGLGIVPDAPKTV